MGRDRGDGIDHSRSDDVIEQLSVQYFDSQYNGGKGGNWAGNGGTPDQFVAFYNSKKFAVPWSNKNAAYQRTIAWNAIQNRNRGLLLRIPR